MDQYSKTAAASATIALKLGVAITAAAMLAGCESEPEPAPDRASQLYASEYPEIPYATSTPPGRLGRLASRVGARSIELDYQAERGYLDSVLAALAIDPSSQMLVYSRTSLQVGRILPETPRAIYFNDDSYVAWIPQSPSLEIASFDPELGPVFYTLPQQQADEPAMERQIGSCLRCHDSYSLTGGGVPRFLLGSGYTGPDGELVSHEAWILTSQATSMRNRWGGWYVTGRHGDAKHLGNIVVQNAEDLQELDSLRIGNVEDLSAFFDTSAYLTPYSDIVALMVLEHQVEVHNLISRLRYEALGTEAGISADELERQVESLVRAMLMVDAIELTAPLDGSSGFAEHFATLGPVDAAGRSLRELDLDTRVFRYPMSYLIYSTAFNALPESVKNAVFARIGEILRATSAQDGFANLSVADRSAIAEILADTLPDFANR
jgi:hypothetical protein